LNWQRFTNHRSKAIGYSSVEDNSLNHIGDRMDPIIKARRVINKSIVRLQNENPKTWSLRKIAKRMKLSPGYLSLVLSGKRPLSKAISERLITDLNIGPLEALTIRKCFHLEIAKAKDERPEIQDTNDETELIPGTAEWLLGQWYRLPLLDLLTTETSFDGPTKIAKRLGISEFEALQSLNYLEQEGLARKDSNGIWRKVFTHIRFPTNTSRAAIRAHHQAQLRRIDQILQNKTAPADFSKRLVIGISAAVDMNNLAEVKAELEAALVRAAKKLSHGTCTEVYQLNLCLVPQTN
jgi:uncharacterized protein (TIGR02147 family)